MSAPLFAAAKKGDRISHNPDQSERSTDTVVAAVLGQSLAAPGAGGALSAQAGAGASCKGTSRASLSITELLPRSTTGTIEVASPTVLVAPDTGVDLAEGEPVDCRNHNDKPIEPGSTTVLVQGLPLARAGGETGCGAILCDGAPTVLVGGPASSGKGTGTQGGTPASDSIAHAGSIAAGTSPTLAATSRGAALAAPSPAQTATLAQGPTGGALGAVAGTFAGTASGGLLGALAGTAL
jgi:uncharacterized Zn-binding protein involved in type VI secretion